jgi:hypothetical protein
MAIFIVIFEPLFVKKCNSSIPQGNFSHFNYGKPLRTCYRHAVSQSASTDAKAQQAKSGEGSAAKLLRLLDRQCVLCRNSDDIENFFATRIKRSLPPG